MSCRTWVSPLRNTGALVIPVVFTSPARNELRPVSPDLCVVRACACEEQQQFRENLVVQSNVAGEVVSNRKT